MGRFFLTDLDEDFQGFGLIRNDEILREAEEMSLDFYKFAEAAWPLFSNEPFQGNWHLGSVAAHLEAVSRDEIFRLIINMPFRSGKSALVAKLWHPWVWTWDPSDTFLFASCDISLTLRDAVAARRVITSPWYQERWGTNFSLLDDHNLKSSYQNSCNGARIGVSTNSKVIGRGGRNQIIDDPTDAKKANSKVERMNNISWYEDAFKSRGENLNKSKIILVMQRIAEDDLTGHLLSEGGWEHLILPNRYESQFYSLSPIGRRKVAEGREFIYEDPRTKEGELLFPARLNEEKTLEFEKKPYFASAQLQQRPVPLGGGIWQSVWCPRFLFTPAMQYRFIVVDTAMKKEQENDYTVMSLFGVMHNGQLAVLDVLRNKYEPKDLPAAANLFWSKHAMHDDYIGRVTAMYIEDKVSGTGLISSLRDETNLPIVEVKRGPANNKTMRFMDSQDSIYAGLVWFPQDVEANPWMPDCLHEMDSLTGNDRHAFDDFCDTLADAIWVTFIEPRVNNDVNDLDRYQRPETDYSFYTAL